MWAKKILCGLGLLFTCAAVSLPTMSVQAASHRQNTQAVPKHAAKHVAKQAPRQALRQAARQQSVPVQAAIQNYGPNLASSSVLAIDLNNGQELYSERADLVRPMASITKLMTAMVVLDADLPLDEVLAVNDSETREMRGVHSRVRNGSYQTRRELMQLALMSSENRAAATLAHYYPGGYPAFIRAMNAKARAIGMRSARFVEPTGLSELNVASARDLMRMLRAANQYGQIRLMSTTPSRSVAFSNPGYVEGFNNTNPLIRNDNWTIYTSKTGFTNEAGHCLVMVAGMAGRRVGVVLLDSAGKNSRFADAVRLRNWLEGSRNAQLRSSRGSYQASR